MSQKAPEIYVIAPGDGDRIAAGWVSRIRTSDGAEYYFPLAQATPEPWTSHRVPSDAELTRHLEDHPEPWLRVGPGGDRRWHGLAEDTAWDLDDQALVVCVGWARPPTWIPGFLRDTPTDTVRRMLLAAGLQMSPRALARASRLDDRRSQPREIDDDDAPRSAPPLFVEGGAAPRSRPADHGSVNSARKSKSGTANRGGDRGAAEGGWFGLSSRWSATLLAAGGSCVLLACLFLVILWRACMPPATPCAEGQTDPCAVFAAVGLPEAAAYCRIVELSEEDLRFEALHAEMIQQSTSDLCASRRPDPIAIHEWSDTFAVLYGKRLIHDHFVDREDFAGILDPEAPYIAPTGELPDLGPLFRQSESWIELDKRAARTEGMDGISPKDLIRELALTGRLRALAKIPEPREPDPPSEPVEPEQEGESPSATGSSPGDEDE